MSKKLKSIIPWALAAIALTAINLFFGVRYPIPALVPSDEIVALGTTHFTNIEVEDLTATDDITATDDLAVTDDATIGGDFTVSGTSSWGCSDTTIGDNLTVGGTITGDSAMITGNISSNTGAITVTDDVLIDGAADGVHLTVQGYAAPTGNLLVVENSAGTDKFEVDASGNITVAGVIEYESVQVSGPVRFGSATSIMDGTRVAHGMGTTPTFVALTPYFQSQVSTATMFSIQTMNATSFTVSCTPTVYADNAAAVYWIAGK